MTDSISEIVRELRYVFKLTGETQYLLNQAADALERCSAGSSKERWIVDHDATYLRGWNEATEHAMEVVGNMRRSEAGLFDAKHSGQRGCDRVDALYDAYVAIRAALSLPTDHQNTGE